MRNKVLLPVIILWVLLAACEPARPTLPLPAATAARPAVSFETAALGEGGCSVISAAPTGGPTQPSLFAPVTAADWMQGAPLEPAGGSLPEPVEGSLPEPVEGQKPGSTSSPGGGSLPELVEGSLPELVEGQKPGSTSSPGGGSSPEPVEGSLPEPVEGSLPEPVEGPPVTFIEYADFQCPYSAALEPVLAELLQKYPTQLRRVLRLYPLAAHDKSLLAAQAAEAAGRQEREAFFSFGATLFARQSQWIGLDAPAFSAWLLKLAAEQGLDEARFSADLSDAALAQQVRQAQEEAVAIGIPFTPFLLINGVPYQGPRDPGSLESILRLSLLEARQFSACPPMTIDPEKTYRAVINTDKGDITLQLFGREAPLAVNSFIFLARQGWYNDMVFHRVIPGFVAQAGDPSGSGYGGPGYAFDNETSPSLRFDKPGLLAMANSGPNSNGSQFFITYAALPDLNGKYTIFGQVTDGMEALKDLAARDPANGGDLAQASKILAVTIEEH